MEEGPGQAIGRPSLVLQGPQERKANYSALRRSPPLHMEHWASGTLKALLEPGIRREYHTAVRAEISNGSWPKPSVEEHRKIKRPVDILIFLRGEKVKIKR